MTVSEVRTVEQFNSLRVEWNELLRQSGADTVFLTHEWLSEWWEAYGTVGDLRILLARDASGMLRGIAPLRRRAVRRYGRTFEVFTFVGDGSGDSDYLDFIVHKDDEESVMGAFFRALKPYSDRGVVLEINTTPESSGAYGLVRRFAESTGMVWSEIDIPCSTVALPPTWDAFLKTLASRFRTKIRSVQRAVREQAAVRFEMCHTPAQLQEYLPALFDLHTRRWAKSAKPGVFGGDDKRQFYKGMSQAMLDRGELVFSALRWQDKILACQYGFVHGQVYSQLQEGYEPESEHWNLGLALRAWSIERLLEAGVTEYDFLAGTGRNKSDWGATIKMSKMAVLAPQTTAGALYCRGPQWVVAARQAVKRISPGKWLEARDDRQERNRIAEWKRSTSKQASAPPWLRSALAAAYFYSPALRIAPIVRDRYRLRVSPTPCLDRRRRATLRILYYHRVNNDKDAFFPSMAVADFEEQIKFVSDHYKVVSLTDAMRRLTEGGPPEPVVAITFDDGYADNYTDALPVLERYGVPTTIFLTTGSLDTREPMWFEVLSLAVKKASGPHIDIELDVPRRLLLRTLQERLDANNTIFAYLRTLADSERRLRLADALRKLNAGPSDELRGRMLTWEQVRDMRVRGVDFGGHTVTHPFVSRLSREQAVWEVTECKRRIEEEVQSAADHFAYPNGREPDFGSWNKQIVAEAGYRAAVSTLWGTNFPGTDPMELRRGQPWEDTLPLFAAKLDWYQLTDE